MFVLKKNLYGLIRYTKTVYKIINVTNNIKLTDHQSIVSQFSLVRTLSSHPVVSEVDAVDNSANLNNGQETHSATLPMDLEIITKGDKELEHKLKVIMLETEVLRQDGKAVPSDEFMTPEIWEHLLTLTSRKGRTKYLEFLFKISKKKQNKLAKQNAKRKEYEESLSSREPLKNLPIEEHALQYGLLCNNIFIRFHDATMNNFYNHRLIQAIQFDQKLVIDCGYDQNMTKRENQNTAKQLMLLFAENRYNDEPFDIHFTNVCKESDLTKMLHKYIPTMYDSEFPMNIHEKSYLDLFPKENLVYLTPHCREEMDSYDHDAVYIIGAIVDKINNEPISLAKAKREGLTMKKFPLDKYLQWGSGSGKSLTINQCVAILLDMKATGDWNHALRHVPRRKLTDTTSIINNFKSYGGNKPFFPQKKNTWKPNTDKKLKVNIRNVYND